MLTIARVRRAAAGLLLALALSAQVTTAGAQPQPQPDVARQDVLATDRNAVSYVWFEASECPPDPSNSPGSSVRCPEPRAAGGMADPVQTPAPGYGYLVQFSQQPPSPRATILIVLVALIAGALIVALRRGSSTL
jgi:hypothetical protein